MAEKPTTTVQAVMDGESYQINIQLLEKNFDFLRGKVPGTLEIQAASEKSRRKLREKDICLRDVIRPVVPQVKTCLSKALDQYSRSFWYFENLNLAYRAAQMQSLTQVDGFYHTFCSTSILSTFFFIGPYQHHQVLYFIPYALAFSKGWKFLLHNKSQLSQGREILRYYVKRSMPICLSTAHWKVRDSSKRFELMLFFSSGNISGGNI